MISPGDVTTRYLNYDPPWEPNPQLKFFKLFIWGIFVFSVVRLSARIRKTFCFPFMQMAFVTLPPKWVLTERNKCRIDSKERSSYNINS